MSEEADNTVILKVLVIGDPGVGKSCLLLRFTDDTYTDRDIPTIGVDYKSKILDFKGQMIKLQVWDTAGQEKFRTITASHYRGAHGAVVIYDTTDQTTFDNVTQWFQEIDRFATGKIDKVIVGNKVDLSANRVVAEETGKTLAEELGCPFVETSAKDSYNVDLAFNQIVSEIMKRMNTQKTPLNFQVQNNRSEKKNNQCSIQ